MKLRQLISTKICVLFCLTVSSGSTLCLTPDTGSHFLAGNVLRKNATQFEVSNFPSNDHGQPDENNTAAGAGSWRV
jgi:hypothetical protein